MTKDTENTVIKLGDSFKEINTKKIYRVSWLSDAGGWDELQEVFFSTEEKALDFRNQKLGYGKITTLDLDINV